MRSIYLFLIIFGFIGFQKTFISYLNREYFPEKPYNRISPPNRIFLSSHYPYHTLSSRRVTWPWNGFETHWRKTPLSLQFLQTFKPKIIYFYHRKRKKKQKEKENENYQKFQSLNPTDPVRILRSVLSVFITIPISLV